MFQAVERGHEDCPICLTALVSATYIDSSKSFFVTKSKQVASGGDRSQKRNKEPNSQSASKFRAGKSSSSKINTENQSKKYENEAEIQTVTRKTVLLSCSHVFHMTCLEMFEELNVDSTSKQCPVCRTKYQKKVF